MPAEWRAEVKEEIEDRARELTLLRDQELVITSNQA